MPRRIPIVVFHGSDAVAAALADALVVQGFRAVATSLFDEAVELLNTADVITLVVASALSAAQEERLFQLERSRPTLAVVWSPSPDALTAAGARNLLGRVVEVASTLVTAP